MDEIKFQMNPKRYEFKYLGVRKALKSKILWIYTALLIIVLIILSIKKVYEEPVLVSIIAYIYLGIIFPYAGISRLESDKYKKFCDENFTFYMNNQGYGFNGNSCEVFVNWKGINKILETRKYIFIKGEMPWTIIKNAIAGDDLRNIKKIILSSGVKDIKLAD